jgi:NAD(P)-dependent dehydrogenase (short-subunit alcohol dehydrogenase family)
MASNAPPTSAISEPVAPAKKWWTRDTVAVVTGGEREERERKEGRAAPAAPARALTPRPRSPRPPLPPSRPQKTANQGIGKEIARQLAAQGLTVVATARDPQRGQDAAAELSSDAAVQAAGGRVVYAPLDLTDDGEGAAAAAGGGASSAQALASALRNGDLQGVPANAPIAILVNNAGLAYKGDAWGAQETLRTLDTNFRGTRRVTRALLPLMVASCRGASAANAANAASNAAAAASSGSPSAPTLTPPTLLPRVVLVTSSAGGLGMFDRAAKSAPGGEGQASAELKRRFEQAGEMEGEDEAAADAALDALASEFEQAVADDTWRAKGWPASMYGVSKALENAYGRQLARRGRGQRQGSAAGAAAAAGALPCWAAVNVHPGYISTSMSSYKGPLPPSRGADTPVWAAMLPSEEALRASGSFYHDRALREY